MPLNTRDLTYPPLDGSLTIPEVLEFHWKHNADLPVYTFCEDGKEATEISYLEFGRACHRVAHYIGAKFPSTGERPVVALIALADTMLYQSICVGLMKAGFIPFPISPRNTAAAVVYLLNKSKCHYVLATRNTLTDLLGGINLETGHDLVVEEIPLIHNIFPKLGAEREEDPFMPFTTDRSPELTDIVMYMHSSGSSGLPKAVPQTHRNLIHWASLTFNTAIKDHTPRLRIAGMHLPPFHGMGVNFHILIPLYCCCTISLFPPLADGPDKLPMTPTPEAILDHVQRTNANVIVVVPTLLPVWSHDQGSLDVLRKMQFVIYGGGALAPKSAAFLVASRIKLYPAYGGTEFGLPTILHRRPEDNSEEDCTYMEFSDRCKVRWIPQGDGTYECHLLTTETHSLSVENLPDVKGYETSDIFEPHPTKKHLWKIVGRVDDVITHSSGEKTVPGPMEDIVSSSPHVMGAVMFGRAHDQPGILVEPKLPYAIDIEDEKQVAVFRNLIWPIINEANQIAPAFSRIFKEMILVTNKNKALPRVGKGTVMRKMALVTYEREIEALYATVESTQATESIEPPRVWDKEYVTQWLADQATELNSGKAIGPSEDLFENGFDSLSATILRRRITGALQSIKTPSGAFSLRAINQNTVYSHPSINTLTDFLITLLSDGALPDDSPQARIELIEDMISKYQFMDPSAVEVKGPQPLATRLSEIVVVLTGSTGNLGSQLLEALLRDPRVVRVYSMNRLSLNSASTSISERHLERFRDKGLDATLLLSDKLRYIESDLSQPNLGLSESLYNEIRDSVDVVIHTAWRLDFNLSLTSFEVNIRGTRNLIELARLSQHSNNIKFIFTSSVGSAQSWDQSLGLYPEDVVMDARYAVGTGYGEAKYICERVLATSGLNFISLRLGQISGGIPNGAWATTDWLPIMVKSSLALGALPMATGVVSWLLVETMSDLILDLAFTAEQYPPAVNIVHPKPLAWNTVMKYIADALFHEKKKSLPFVPFSEWISLLERCSDSVASPGKDHLNIPAIKLLEFFKKLSTGDLLLSSSNRKEAEAGGLPEFLLQNMFSLDVSGSMQKVLPLDSGDAERWVKYWNRAGLFNN